MYRQIVNFSFVLNLLTIILSPAAFAQPLVSPNRIISFQANIQDGNVSFATSIDSPIAAPVIHYRPGAYGTTWLLADFASVVYPYSHQMLTVSNTESVSAEIPVQKKYGESIPIERIGFEQLNTTPPIFRVAVEGKNAEAFKALSFQADYGRLTISWREKMDAIKTEDSKVPQTANLCQTNHQTSNSCRLLFTTASLMPDSHFKNLTVVLDAGHGGSDPGAQREGIQEKEITLAIVNRLKNNLEAKGIKVLLTRSDDIFVSLEDRVTLTNQAQPDLFLSVHINALENNSAIHGVETYYKTPQSQALAQSIHDSLVSDLGIPDRLVRKARFYVINHTEVPAVLAEVGFISSQEERAKLISPDYQNQVAQALERGVSQYLSSPIARSLPTPRYNRSLSPEPGHSPFSEISAAPLDIAVAKERELEEKEQ
jgi:N-acetylmuramoyl-L-alanine amidase